MKILFITDNFPPEVNAPATRTYEHCRAWITAGADVTVLTCAPNFPQGKVFDGYENRLYQREVMDGIKVIRVWSYMTRNEGFARRVLDYTSFAFTAFLAGLPCKCDVIIATSPQFFTTFTGTALSWLKRKPWIFELRDLWPESIGAVGAVKNQRLMSFLERIEIALYRSSARIVAVTDAFKDNLVGRGIDPAKISVVTNGVDPRLIGPRPKDLELLAELGLNGKTVLGYIGTHGMAHGLDVVLKAMAMAADTSLHALFVGDGAEKRNLVEEAKRRGLMNVTFLDPVPKADVTRYLSLIDLALVPLRRSETFRAVIPSKIFEAAAMEKPIILGVEGQAQKLIERYGAGLCYTPDDPEALLNVLQKIQSDEALIARLKDGCRRLTQDFDRRKLASNMLGDLKNVAGF